jgi:hypothetical protein
MFDRIDDNSEEFLKYYRLVSLKINYLKNKLDRNIILDLLVAINNIKDEKLNPKKDTKTLDIKYIEDEKTSPTKDTSTENKEIQTDPLTENKEIPQNLAKNK